MGHDEARTVHHVQSEDYENSGGDQQNVIRPSPAFRLELHVILSAHADARLTVSLIGSPK